MGGFVVTPFTFAETFDPAIDGLIRNQQRQAELEKIIQPERDVNLEVVKKKKPENSQTLEVRTGLKSKQFNFMGK